MSGQKHIINRQVLELTIRDKENVWAVQNRTSALVKEKLHPELDKLFTRLSNDEEIVRIDKLVVDLGTIQENGLEQVFVETAIRKISEQVNSLIAKGKSSATQKTEQKNKADDRDLLITNKLNDYLDQFLFFLKNGYFPWWHEIPGTEKFSSQNLSRNIFKEILNVDNDLLRNTFLPLLKNQNVRKRLIYQYNHSYLYELLKKLNAGLLQNLSAQLRILQNCSGSVFPEKKLSASFYEFALQYFENEQFLKSSDEQVIFLKKMLDLSLAGYSAVEKENKLALIIQSSQKNHPGFQQEDFEIVVIATIQSAVELPFVSQHLNEIILNVHAKSGAAIDFWINEFARISQKKVAGEKWENQDLTDSSEILSTEKTTAFQKKNVKESFSLFPQKPPEDAETILVSNAGLVIFHPFLKFFFEGLGLLNSELQFKNTESVFKAIHLLQFIATGEETAEETDLVLNKILCGVEISEPVPQSVQLSEEEKEECIFLMKTVLERWEALRTGNPAALRDTYLRREGILKRAGASWNLVIERNTFDIMLERLPWSVSLVKLPWCEEILYVEW